MEDILFFLKKYWKDVLFAFFIIISIAISCFCLLRSPEEEESITPDLMANVTEEEQEEPTKTEEAPEILHVDIKGAVTTPGVYEVQKGAIINDIVTLAGGFLEDAYQEGINLSKKVEDEMVVYIYTEKEINSSKVDSQESTSKTEESTTTAKQSETTSICNSKSYNINDCILKTESVIVPDASSNPVAPTPTVTEDTNEVGEEESTLININTASKSKLTELSGIGEVKAQAIIDYRNSSGSFKSIEEILNVSGIGDAVFEKIKDYITV